MSKSVIRSSDAPEAIGPYSQAIRTGDLLFVSGQIGLHPETGELVPGGVEAETRQALENLASVLTEAGATFEHVVKATIYLNDLSDFETVNDLYGDHFSAAPPARATVEVSALPKGAEVEIELIASLAD